MYRNVSLASLRRFSRASFVRERAEVDAAREVTEQLDVRPADPRRRPARCPAATSRRSLLARWLLRGCRVLLLDEPTRGVDVGARTEIYQLIRRLADEGVAVVLVSSEVPEVLGMSHRVLVLREGRVVHEAPAGELDESKVLDLVMEGSAA